MTTTAVSQGKPLIHYPTSSTCSCTLKTSDMVPLLSTPKGLVDYFCKKYWKPDVSQLGPCARSYYYHLIEKESFRYIAIIPFAGNFAILLAEACKCLAHCFQKKEIPTSSQPAPQSLSSGGGGGGGGGSGGGVSRFSPPAKPNPKAVDPKTTVGFKKPPYLQIQRSFKEKTEAEYFDDFLNEDPDPVRYEQAKKRICLYLQEGNLYCISRLQKEAQDGDLEALKLLVLGIKGVFSSEKTTNALFDWLVEHAENPQSKIHEFAQEHLFTILSYEVNEQKPPREWYGFFRKKVVEYYQKVFLSSAGFTERQLLLLMENFDFSRFNYSSPHFVTWMELLGKIIRRMQTENVVQNTDRKEIWKAKIAHKAAKIFLQEEVDDLNEEEAIPLFKMAAKQGYFPAMHRLAWLYFKLSDDASIQGDESEEGSELANSYYETAAKYFKRSEKMINRAQEISRTEQQKQKCENLKGLLSQREFEVIE